jgi:hypothetical protein
MGGPCISAFVAESLFIGEEEVAVPGEEVGLWFKMSVMSDGYQRGRTY